MALISRCAPFSFRDGFIAASLKAPFRSSSCNLGTPFRDGFIAASLKEDDWRAGRECRLHFPRWIHRGLIEGVYLDSLLALLGTFPRWIHRGLIEGFAFVNHSKKVQEPFRDGFIAASLKAGHQ